MVLSLGLGTGSKTGHSIINPLAHRIMPCACEKDLELPSFTAEDSTGEETPVAYNHTATCPDYILSSLCSSSSFPALRFLSHSQTKSRGLVLLFLEPGVLAVRADISSQTQRESCLSRDCHCCRPDFVFCQPRFSVYQIN